jgi:hypothetical protein
MAVLRAGCAEESQTQQVVEADISIKEDAEYMSDLMSPTTEEGLLADQPST